MIKTCICVVPVVTIYELDTASSRIVSQLLFGECALMIEKKETIVKVAAFNDSINGWVDIRQIVILDDDEAARVKTSKCIVFDKTTEIQVDSLPYTMKISPGSEMHLNGKFGNQMVVGEHTYMIKQRISTPMHGNKRHAIISRALEFLHVPQMWGGRSINGIDVAEFVQLICKMNEVELPGVLSQQIVVGRPIKELSESMLGDVVFFTDETNVVNHVGFIHEKQKIIHVDGLVRIDTIDENGLFNENIKKYTHKVAYIRNVVD